MKNKKQRGVLNEDNLKKAMEISKNLPENSLVDLSDLQHKPTHDVSLSNLLRRLGLN